MNSNDKLAGSLKKRIGLLESFPAMRKGQAALFKEMCEEVSEENKAILASIVEFIDRWVTVTGHQPKLAGGYTGQPSGCRRLTLTYGYLQCDGEIVRWVARIYFTKSGPRMGFPIECLKRIPKAKIDIGKDAFSPKDIKDFFKCPDNYLNWKKLKAR